MNLMFLRLFMIFDAAVLMVLGLAMVTIPGRMLEVFHFPSLPPDAQYLIAMWGCVLGTLGVGYVWAATDPRRHILWVQIGIVRGALEALVGLAYVATGIVTWHQSGFGIAIGAFVGLVYWMLYPVVEPAPGQVASQARSRS